VKHLRTHLACLALASVCLCNTAAADQPIFDEMPRWNGGWGFQILEEYRTESRLLDGDEPVASGFSEEVHILHVEGVYTWTKEVRATLKLPVVLHAERTVPEGAGERRETDRGLGDPTIAVPFKSYFNLDGRTGSWTFAPQVRVPGGVADDYDIYDRAWGAGMSVGYSTETYRYHFGVGSSTWIYADGDEPLEVFYNLAMGINVHGLGSSGYLKWKTSVKHDTNSSFKVTAGPVAYWRFTDTVHGQLKYQHDFYDRQGGVDHGDGDSYEAGVGFVF
jgi:hypothetical protein